MAAVMLTILLFAGAFVAAAISGAAGFGGALLLLPVVTGVVGVRDAIPLVTVAQLVGNLTRAALGARQIEWRSVALFVATGIPASIAGALSFTSIPTTLLTRAVGVALLVFVGLRVAGVLRFESRSRETRLLLVGGAVTGFLSGLLGSSGPLGAAIFLSLGLPPVAYIATDASASLLIHLAKSTVYLQQLQPGDWFVRSAAVLSAGMLLGTVFARRIVKRMPAAVFERWVTVLLVLAAAHMVIVG